MLDFDVVSRVALLAVLTAAVGLPVVRRTPYPNSIGCE
jgi:hypothetical protein